MNCFALALVIGAQGPIDTTKDIESKLLLSLDQHFWDSSRSRWREMAGKDDEVFLWGYSVLFSTFAIGAKVDPATYKPRLERVFDGVSRYWTDRAPGGYAVLPGQSKNPDRYYDDNAWVGLAAMEAYGATKENKYLDVAKRAYRFVKSGEDKKLGGRIYWHENDKKSKNACVSGPAACLAFQLYREIGGDGFLRDANNWLSWTQKLVDPADGLVMDNMSLSGKIERTKWSYNSAMFAQALLLRHEQKGRYGSPDGEKLHGIAQLFECLQSSSDKWIDQSKKQVTNPGMFAMHLIETLASANDKFGKDPSALKFETPLEFGELIASIFEKSRNDLGLFGEYWDRKPLPDEKLKLMYTASLLRTALFCRTR